MDLETSIKEDLSAYSYLNQKTIVNQITLRQIRPKITIWIRITDQSLRLL